MFTTAIANTKKFQSDEKGSVAMLFGLTAIGMCMFAGLALDGGRAFSAKAKVAAAADAAALAAVKGMRLEGLSEAAAIALARSVVVENMKGGSGNWTDIAAINVTVDSVTFRAVVDIDASVKTTFGALAGVPRLNTDGAATAVFESRDIEVSLQLDLTGSMCNLVRGVYQSPCTDHPKIQGLKDATKDLVNLLLPDTPGVDSIRVAFAPFTAGVNLGDYQSLVADGRTTGDRCVYERVSETNQASDLAPIANDSYMIRSDLQGSPHNVANPRWCPNAPVIPLTNEKQLLKDTVDAYVADGSTAGHNGTAWAWNMLSPNFAGVWPAASEPAAYNDGKTSKSVLLMTDGEYNTKNGRDWNSNQVSTIAVNTCNAMKAQGIRVYTVGFALTNATAVNTMAACASNPSDFYQAATGEELRTAFKSIANNIVRLRLTN